MSLEGQKLGEFEILERIGQGGMGAVYKARQTSLRRLVALKTLQAALAGDGEYIARFQQEALAAAVLNHPNLVQVISAGESDGLHWFAMEYVEGESAKVRLNRKGRLDPLEAIAIVIHVATALEYGWRKASLIHRDIKPDNIFLSSDGEVKLGDLGLAKSAGQTQGLTVTGHSMGTPHYISPEQVEAMKDVDLRADIYSLGCTLYHMLGGKPPFDGNSPVSIMMKHVNGPVPDLRRDWPECPPELAGVVGKMMQKAPDERQQNYAEVTADLRRAYDVLSGATVPSVVAMTQPSPAGKPSPAAKSPPAPSPAGEKKRGVPMAAWAGGLVACAAAGALLYFAPWKKADANPGGTRSVASQTSAGEGGKEVGADRATPSSATKDAPFVNTLGMKFVPVPGSKVLFSIWDTRVQDYAEYARVNEVADGWKTQQRDGVLISRAPDDPVVGVNWEDAQAFCQWLTEKEQAMGKLAKGLKYRLPTDEEWSRAVGLPPELGTTPADKNGKNGVDFPWGRDYPPKGKVGNYADETSRTKFPLKNNEKNWIEGYNDGYATTSPVGSFPANAYGLYDMGGNVWQWCQDWFDNDQREHFARGGSWAYSDRVSLLSSHRHRVVLPASTGRFDSWGFRCVLGEFAPPAATASEAGGTRSVASQTSVGEGGKKVSAAGASLPALPVAGWQPMITDWEKLKTMSGVTVLTDGWLRLDHAYLHPPGGVRDIAVRVRLRFEGRETRVFGVRERNPPGEFYSATVSVDGQTLSILKQTDPKIGVRELATAPLARTLDRGQEYDLFLAASGNDLIGYIDGQPIVYARDDELTGWVCTVGSGGVPETLKDPQWMRLSAPGGAPPNQKQVSAMEPATATKDAPYENTLGMKFVPVPGTNVLFSVWDTRVQDYAKYAQVNKVDDSWHTQQKDGVLVSRDPDDPVVGVSWEDAQAFCQWLTEKENGESKLPKGMKYRLPTDEEWSWAVGLTAEQGTTPAEKTLKNTVDLPWGKDYPPKGKVGNYADEAFHAKFPLKKNEQENQWIEGYDDGYATTSVVGSFPANAYGLYDMGGNVWQWCEDWFNALHKDRVLRGASWYDYARGSLSSSNRNRLVPTTRSSSYGFRCVLEPVPSTLEAVRLEPGAIKLWDAPEKIPAGPGVRWEDGALRLDERGKIDYSDVQSRDATIRASIRMNADADAPQLDLRWGLRGPKANFYRLALFPSNQKAELFSVVQNEVKRLASWPLPRAYRPDEWVRLELRAVGEQLTAMADGQVLGAVRDTAIMESGGVSLYANAKGYFRDIVYVPLDTPGPSTSTPVTATKNAPFENTLGMKFVPVPGTKVLFSVWDTRVQDYAEYARANKVDDAWKTEQKDGVPVSQEPDYPVVGASWEDAQGFCQWLTEKEQAEGKLPKGLKYRLPTDEEWSTAVGLPLESGTTPAEKAVKNSADFPWGKDYPPTKKVGNYADEAFHAKFPPEKNETTNRMDNPWIEGYDDGYATTSPVGNFPANVYGLHDMGGNVWQFCGDWFDATHQDRVSRGASWGNNERGHLLSSNRRRNVPTYRDNNHGFRCVLELAP